MSGGKARSILIPEMIDLIIEAYEKDPRQNLGFKGTPGIGKTEGIYTAATTLKEKYPTFFTKVMILSQMESVDFRMPWVDSANKYRFIPVEDLRWEPTARGFLFFDEAANASPDVMKAVQQVMSDRRLGDIIIPDGVMILIASNNKEDRAGANTIPTAFANRIEWHQVEPDVDGWLDWAFKRKIDVALMSYIKKFPNMLNSFKADREINATPRSWAKVHKVLGSKFEYDRISGNVGEEFGTQFAAWLKMFQEFPEKEDIEDQPEKAKVPKNADAQFAMALACSQWVEKKTWNSYFAYINRFNLEYQTLFLKEAARLKPEEGFKRTKQFTDWAIKYQKDIL